MESQHLGAIMEAGYIFLGMGRMKEAKEVFEGLQVLAPESELPLVALGNLSFCQGAIKKAIKLYDRALKKDSSSAFAKVYKAEALFFLHEIDDAKVIFQEVIDTDDAGAAEFASSLMKAIDEGFQPPKKQGESDVENS